MIYKDRLHGQVEISNPLVLEIIQTSSLQRLKNIDQAGYFEPHFPGKAYSRFEHSLGVYLLLKKYQVPLEEQIAGLIHDVSHGVFSHCLDYVLNLGSEKEQSHQDNIFKEFVSKTEIPSILEKHQMNVNYILDEHNFPLAEKPLPDLCADRIDYALRTAMVFNEIDKEKVDYFLNHLTTENNSWVFKDFESAQKFAQLFLTLNTLYFTGLPTALMFTTVGSYLKYALEKEYVTESDLYTTDNQVLKKINQYLNDDQKLQLLFDRMNNKIKAKHDSQDFDVKVFCKSRIIDPFCKHKKEIKKVSEINSNWAEIVKKELIPKEYFIKFV